MSKKHSRREFIQLCSSIVAAAPTSMAYGARGAAPTANQGLAFGDPSPDGVVVWSRSDQLSSFHVEWSEYEDFRYVNRCPEVDAHKASDFTTKLALRDLPSDREIFVRAHYRSLTNGKLSERLYGRFNTPSLTPTKPFRFTWSGDLGGQGFGINPEIGGYRIFETIQKTNPDIFVNCGDIIYADGPLRDEKKVDNGQVWKNIVTDEKTEVAQSLRGFRGNHRYNYLDPNFRDLNAVCPTIYTWDDHETKNNWWLSRELKDKRYTQRQCLALSAWARQSFFEYTPIASSITSPKRIYRRLNQGSLAEMFVLDSRSYRGPNSRGLDKRHSRASAMLGSAQVQWLVQALKESNALWKFIVSPQPIALNIHDGKAKLDGYSNNHNGTARGRELELAYLLGQIKDKNVHNVVWLTADVHYAAAHHFSPERARSHHFNPFWEFVAGPLNAATFGPNSLDQTFGPKLIYSSLPKGIKPGTSPLEPYQFFGQGEIEPSTGLLTINFFNQFGTRLWQQNIEPYHA